MVDNPFARFDIDHLSPTSMLQFRNDPALGIIYLIYGIREAGSPAMHRGQALDQVIGEVLAESGTTSCEGAVNLATEKYDALIAETEESYSKAAIRKEREIVVKCMTHCHSVISDWKSPLSYQHPIRLMLTDIEVPVIGFIDLHYPSEVRELKSSARPRWEIVEDHAFQVVAYAMAIRQETGEWPKAVVDYITPQGMKSYRVVERNRWVQEVVNTAGQIRELLASCESREALCSKVRPDFSRWIWRYRPNAKQFALKHFTDGNG